MTWKPPRKQRPRDERGQFRSRASIRAEQEASRFESLQIGREMLFWQAQDAAYDEDTDDQDE
jgi:hypothetical protein